LPDVERLRQVPPARLQEAAGPLRGSTPRLTLMLQSMNAASAIFFAMHWTLLVFRKPVLATSDHPIVLWPMSEGALDPSSGAKCGLLETLEVRYPLTSRVCLLMTWAEGPDPDRPVPGRSHHAKNLNAFTAAHAEREWFCLPETRPPIGSPRGRFLPLGPELCPGYGPADVVHSQRRTLVEQKVREESGKPLERHPTFPAILVEERQ